MHVCGSCACTCTLRVHVREFFLFAPHSPLRSAAREHHPSGGVHPAGAHVNPSGPKIIFFLYHHPSGGSFWKRSVCSLRAREQFPHLVHASKSRDSMPVPGSRNFMRFGRALWRTLFVKNVAKINENASKIIKMSLNFFFLP